MANPEHLAKLKEDVKAWNEWRRENPMVPADLSRAHLSRADLRGANLSGANLSRAELFGANLHRANLSRADLFGANLRGANLTNAKLSEAGLFEANLSGANLSGAEVFGAGLRGANFSEAKLSGANLFGVNLNGADLSRADLSAADLRGAGLGRANLNGANLSRADLSGTDLTRAIVGFTVFGGNDLSTVVGLDTVRHAGPSTIGIDSIFLSKGKIPEVFLHGAGVPDTLISYLPSCVGNPFDYYSCFISYSTKDEEFAKRLHSDLQANGVRCWFAPEDLKIGDKFRTRIDESIRIYDKLLLILSENSIASSWVEEEVEAALERERLQNRLVLFPIRLDDSVMMATQAWAASLRRARHIGDFHNWKDHDAYQKAFQRLLRDLKNEDLPKSATAGGAK